MTNANVTAAMVILLIEGFLIVVRRYIAAVLFAIGVICIYGILHACTQRAERIAFRKRHVVDFEQTEPGGECIICLVDYDIGERIRRLSCGHEFHIACDEEWHKRGKGCAVCRATEV